MTTLRLFTKYVLTPVCTVAGIFYGVDRYVIERAETVVEPTKVKVESIKSDVEEIKIRTRNIEKILMDRTTGQ